MLTVLNHLGDSILQAQFETENSLFIIKTYKLC
jgi:hypothetical protein